MRTHSKAPLGLLTLSLLLAAACSDPGQTGGSGSTDTQAANDTSSGLDAADGTAVDAVGADTTTSDAEADTTADVEADAEADTAADVVTDAETDAAPDAEADAVADAGTDAEADTAADAEADAASDAEADTEQDATADVEADTQEDAIADVETDAVTDAVADAEADAATDTVADAEADTVADVDVADIAGDATVDGDVDAAGSDTSADAEADAVDEDSSADCGSGCDVLAPGGDVVGDTEGDGTGPGPCPAGSDNKPCDDGDACTKDDVCTSGTCVGGGLTDCDDADNCTVDTCDEKSGCAHKAKDGCKACKAVGDCDDGNACTTDACDLAAGCTSTANDAACSDGDACTDKDVCQGGVCKAGAAVVCDDNNPCTTDACDAKQGCTTSPLPDDTACGDGKVCKSAGCVDKPGALPAGAVVITEVMFDPDKVGDSAGEWFELYNPGEAPVKLNGLVIKDKTQKHVISANGDLLVPAKSYVTLGANADDKVNGGVTHLYAFKTIALGNTDGVLRLENADGSLIDEVKYLTSKGKEGWPGKVSGRSIQLAADSFAADKNDNGANWCFTSKTFGAGDSGTPGAPPQACTVGWCRFQWNPDVTLTSGEKSTWYARVWAPGITDATDGTDVSSDLTGDLGIGKTGTEPWTDASWTFVALTANTSWDAKAANEPNNDEYQVENAPTQAPGTWATAFRFFLRGSTKAVYCDKANGPGKDGAEDGYQVDQAGKLVILGAVE
ncbi:MAG: lamin tail domain-containing protein [Deltaproteobacteria bacterium]|nr:lamin tail domain-containing protein [Deltaproteobacteria bacterium]